MGIPNGTHQIAADAIASVVGYYSLHTGAGGGTTGANEATGGGYGRVATGTGVSDGVGDVTFPQQNLPCAAGTYTEGGFNAIASGQQLSPPSGLAAALATGGTLTVGTPVYYKLTAFNWQGETIASAEVSATPTTGNQSVALSWSALTGVSGLTGIAALKAGFKLYRGLAAGAENVLVATIPASATSYTDTGAAGTSLTPPASNTAGQFVGSAPFTGGNVVVTGTGASINLTGTVTA